MAEISIDPDYVKALVLKVRAIMVEEANEVDDVGSNPTDDETPPDEFQDDAEDLRREEIVEEIEGLNELEQAELIALMWLGRGDGEPSEWSDLVDQARERRESSTVDYLLDHPHVADHWLEALSQLDLGGLVDGTEKV
ncbi:hypothetical protein A7A08_02203 [Methyloligella halotolerans]|uniref:DUF3775 domain-containing protein n=1 Tax=Methyloligella halotolerans TaxID=1177755 RepID=A0A1E2RXE1_9HYPH|nr:DUF3775 domain-containing protein [Methyloligella halotolerans]ODA66906.1 hypothetical protein A7A08_02203 [Methyloligella halotolerans]